MSELPVKLPSGEEIDGVGPVVVIGPNGSGKTRLSRQLMGPAGPPEFVNALRSTRISPQIQAMSQMQARSNHEGHRQQARNSPWEITSDFDFMLAQILAEDGDAARAYRARSKAGESVSDITKTPLETLEAMWGEVFQGRTLHWEDWAPVVRNEKGQTITYTASQMSDGERAALYLGAKVMLAPRDSLMVIDEPETHFHSLLAIALWDALESLRDDMRFVYVTHDLSFAMSRTEANYLLADGAGGLNPVILADDLPSELKKSILGAASFSYYANRVVFCEGESHSLDTKLFSAWFNGRDTVVAPVGSCDAVKACVDAVSRSNMIDNLEAVGVIDRDFRPNEFFMGLADQHIVLPVHEIEGILCVQDVCDVLTDHFGRDRISLLMEIPRAIDDDLVLRVAFERWKAAILNRLEDRVTAKPQKLEEALLRSHATDVFEQQNLAAESAQTLGSVLAKVRSDRDGGDLSRILETFPSKQLAGVVTRHLGQSFAQLFELMNRALVATGESPLTELGQRLENALSTLGLPARRVEQRTPAKQ
ncbi:MAG TPA: AAA family ATPase [Mycobacterium sp.]